jgi:hypothetical protein
MLSRMHQCFGQIRKCCKSALLLEVQTHICDNGSFYQEFLDRLGMIFALEFLETVESHKHYKSELAL